MPTFIGGAWNSDGSSDTTIATSGSLNVSAGDTIVAYTSNFTSGAPIDITSVTDTEGNTYAYVGEISGDASANHLSEMWVAYDCAANATNTVTVNFASSASGRRIAAANYSGIADASLEDSDFVLGGTGTTQVSGDLTTAGDAFLIIGITDWSGPANVTGASGTTLDFESAGAGDDTLAILSKAVTGAGTYNLDYALDASQSYIEMAAAFAGAKTASGTPNLAEITASGVATLVTSVVITDVDGDEAWTDGDTGLVITGTGFV